MKSMKLKPMIESGILAAAAVVLALISFYVPLLGSFTIAVVPLPIIVLIVRHGVRWGVMATAVTAALIGMFVGPLAAVNIMALCGLLGIALGYAYRRRFSAVRALVIGSAAGIMALLVSLALSFFIMGVNPIALETEFIDQAVGQAVLMQREAGASEVELAELQTMLAASTDMVTKMLPAAFALAEVILAYINFIVAGLVLRRLGESNLPALPPVREWRMPGAVVYVFILSLIGQYWGVTRELELLNTVSLNLHFLSLFFGFLQGLALLFFFAERFNLSNFMRGIILLLILMTGLFQFVGILGLFDIAIDYRRRLSRL